MKSRRTLASRALAVLLKGLVVVLPILATIAITIWLWGMFDALLGRPLKWVLPNGWYVPGMGAVLALLLIFFVGLLLDVWLVRQALDWAEDLLERVPLVKSIYGSFRDLIGFFSSKEGRRARQVVLVKAGPGGGELLGLVTREDWTDLPPEVAGPDTVAVYVPMSYALGGYTVLVPRAQVRPVNLTMEEAMRFAITAGMAVKQAQAAPPPPAAAPPHVSGSSHG